MRLKDKVAIVTGGGVGIGKAYAHGLAKEGVKVVVADIQDGEAKKVVADIKSGGDDALSVYVDVTSMEKTQAMAQAALSAYGRIDILVNNAGLYSALKKGPRDGGECKRLMALRQSSLPSDETAGERQDHQYFVRNRARRLALFSPLCLVERRGDRIHASLSARSGRR